MPQIDDLIRTGAEEVVLSAVATLLRPQREIASSATENHDIGAISICKVTSAAKAKIAKSNTFDRSDRG